MDRQRDRRHIERDRQEAEVYYFVAFALIGGTYGIYLAMEALLWDMGVLYRSLLAAVCAGAVCYSVIVAATRDDDQGLPPRGARRRPTAPSASEEDPSESYTIPSTSEETVKWVQSCPDSDPYRMLCVQRTATTVEIKRAFRQMSLRTHPDKTTVTGAEDAFKKLARASYILTDEDKRREFDEESRLNDLDDMDMEDPLRTLFELVKERAAHMPCDVCGELHPKTKVDRPAHASRYIKESDRYLPSKNGDVWAEVEMMYMWHCYMNDRGTVYEISEWGICHELDKALQPNAVRVVVRLVNDVDEGRRRKRGGGKHKKGPKKNRKMRVNDFGDDDEGFAAFCEEIFRMHGERNSSAGDGNNAAPSHKKKKKKK
eukprot:m.34548 g.34548  ORF g.34548 m.34548 type:complete len:372 (-) comp5151_c0_seq2:77-1192(-)